MRTHRLLFLIAVTSVVAFLGAAPAVAAHGGGGGGGGSNPTISSVSTDTATPAPNASGSGQVQLSASAPSGGVVVTLTSSDSTALTLPATLTIAAGQTAAQFGYSTAAVTSATSVTITAALGSSTASTIVTVTPAKLQSVLTLPGEIIGGDTDTIRPQLSGPAPAGGVLVDLSSDSALVPVPASVLIPAGSFSAPVSVTTGSVSAINVVTITASASGVTASGQVQLDPPAVPASLTLDPATTDGTKGATGTVRLAAPAPANGTTVTLSSSDPSVAGVPATTSVGSFGSAAQFTVTTTAVDADTPVTISATAGGTTVSATLTVVPTPPPAPALQSVTVAQASVASGRSATGTATLNVAAPAGGAQVSLFSSNPAVASVPPSVTIPAGATSSTFTVSTRTQSATNTVSIAGTYAGSGRAGLLGVIGQNGAAALPPPPSGTFVESILDPIPVGDSQHDFFLGWSGSIESFTVTLASGALPPGMTLVSPFRFQTADFHGTPTTEGTYAFTLKFTGSAGTVFAVPFVWEITPPAPIVVSQANFGPGTVGQPYDGGFFYGGGVAPYTWSISAGTLPDGLTINRATSEVSGTPKNAGTFSFTARVTDSRGAFLDNPETITVSPG